MPTEPLIDLGQTRRKKLSAEPLRTDRLPPHSIEAEQGVLGAIMLCPNENISECLEKFNDGSDVFYDLRHQAVFEVMVEIYNDKQVADLILIQQRLKDKNQLEAIGGFAYLASLPDKAGTAGHLGSYVQVLLEKHTLRKMIRVCSDVLGRVYEHEGEVDLLLDEVEVDILAIRDNSAHESKSAKTLVGEALHRLELLHGSKGAITGLSTGISDIDRMTDGLHNGEMIVIAALPSVGKSAMAMNILVHNANQGNPVGFYSAEMRPVQLMLRSICSEARVNLYDVRDGIANEGDFMRLTTASARLSNLPIHIENASGWSVNQLQASARRMKQQYDIKLMAVDYLQLLSANSDHREREVSMISKGCKAIAMELGIPVLVLSQVNDEGQLRESRAIGQDADGIWKLEKKGEWQPKVQPVDLKIEKNKEGPTGLIDLVFEKTYTRFFGVQKVDSSDYQRQSKD